MPSIITVAGLIDDWKMIRAKEVVEMLMKTKDDVDLDFKPLVEPEWEAFRDGKAQQIGGPVYSHTKSPIVLINETEYVGGLDELEAFVGSELGETLVCEDEKPYQKAASEAQSELFRGTGNIYCYFDIKIGDAKPRHLVFELYTGTCPRTCENFRMLCEGLASDAGGGKPANYKGSQIHRIVQDGWIQGGDPSGRGDAGHAANGDTFPDESFDIKFDKPGVLAMACNGAHSNASQFFITFAPLPWLNHKAVAFGRVVKGNAALRALNKLETSNERPVEPVVVAGCGEVDLDRPFGS